MFVASYSEGLFSYLLSACLWFFPRLYPRLRSRTLQFPVSRQFLARSPIFVCIPLLLLSSPLFFANPESLAFVGYEIRWSYSPSFFLLFSLRFLFFSSFILFVLPASTAIEMSYKTLKTPPRICHCQVEHIFSTLMKLYKTKQHADRKAATGASCLGPISMVWCGRSFWSKIEG